ncbi:hypothetical protein [Wenzhouxiangella sediminis]|uniref:hypothetical protein n=1 Tax=Wenzhouxiangella sediminis TaxID=1792836 RepID=UPI0011C06F82|nr:hypothetical protein [Wenzhouxiangella sediminis]
MKQRLLSICVLAVSLVAAQAAWSLPRTAGSVHLTPYAGMSWFVAGFELGPWEQYLVNEITPELERLSAREIPHVSWLHFDETIILPDFALPLMRGEGRSPLRLSFRQSRLSLMLGESLSENIRRADRFQQSIVMPGLTHSVSENSDLTVSAVLASQQFGTAAMNLQQATTRMGIGERIDTLYFDPARTEISHGTGLRFALSSELVTGVRLEAAFQSRINMDEFATVRGVHGASAELDIPPRLQVGLEFHATPRSWLNFGVSQIFYSDVGAFPSQSLPARFTALLGDRNSPDFAWDDLTVYSLGWRWRAADDIELFVDYRTRTQPRPTAPTLAAALDSELASNAVIAGLSKDVGKRSRLHLNAAYAPPEYAFGGNLLGVISDELDQDLEVQAMMSFDF